MEECPFNNVPTFILKLWKMLGKTEAADIMFWNPTGKSFIIHNQVLFITKLLPMYFKHNNMGSFIRQLNLYDFHKICGKNLELEYHHKYFQRDQPDLLKYIKRKLPQYKRASRDHDELTNLSTETAEIKNKQEQMIEQLNLLHQENTALLKEIATMRTKYSFQNQIIKKIIEYLMPLLLETRNNEHGHDTENSSNNFLDLLSNVNPTIEINPEPISENIALDNDISTLLTDSDVLHYDILMGQSNDLGEGTVRI